MKKGLVLRIATLALIMSAAIMPLGTAARATVPGGNGKIAFYRWRGRRVGGTPHQIVTMDPDGSNPRQITNSPRTSSDYRRGPPTAPRSPTRPRSPCAIGSARSSFTRRSGSWMQMGVTAMW